MRLKGRGEYGVGRGLEAKRMRGSRARESLGRGGDSLKWK